jgi:zinc finger protein
VALDPEYQSFIFKQECASCGFTEIELRRLVYSAQKLEIITEICPKCSYRNTRIADLNAGGVYKHVFRVKNQDDLNTLVYRSPNADIKVPELGLEISHTNSTQPIITTIEGFLIEVKKLVGSMFPQNEIVDFIGKVNSALRGELDLTFILEDDSGASWISPKHPQ